jgi:hypothetical protein
MYSDMPDTSWRAVAGPDAPLWAGADAAALWPSASASPNVNLVGQQSGVAEIVRNMKADLSSAREYTVARTSEGSSWGTAWPATRTAWLVMSARLPQTRRNGDVMSLSLLGDPLKVSTKGDLLSVSFRDVDLGSCERSNNDYSVTTVALGVDTDTAYMYLKEGGVFTSYRWITKYSGLVVTGLEIGGASSPEMLVYAASAGDGGPSACRRVFDMFTGFLSC